MKITDFNVRVAQREGKRQQLSIAQISEVMAVANALLGGQLYALISPHCAPRYRGTAPVNSAPRAAAGKRSPMLHTAQIGPAALARQVRGGRVSEVSYDD